MTPTRDPNEPSTGALIGAAASALLAILKNLLMIAGPIVFIVGLFVSSGPVILWGIGLTIVGFALHFVINARLAATHNRAAIAAAAGIGPVPPADVQKHLARQALRLSRPSDNSYLDVYQDLVGAWAADQASRSS